jgi:hypothetical protein
MFYQGIMPQQLFSLHESNFQVGSGNLSPAIWNDALGSALPADGINGGVLAGDDFTNFAGWSPAIGGAVVIPAAAEQSAGGYAIYTDTATSASSVAAKSAAVNTCRMATGGTDNHEVWLTTGSNLGALGSITDTAGSERFMAFEAVFSVGQIAANTGAAFVGLAEPGLAAADTKANDTGVLASKDLIGFDTVQADPSLLNVVYRKAGQALVTVEAAAATLVADTLVNVGIVYNPKSKPSEKIRFYINNEVVAVASATNIATATFPDGELLAFLAGIKTGAASAAYLDLKKWRFFQSQFAS